MKNYLLTFSTLLSTFFSHSIFAQATPHINHRQYLQEQQIDQAIKSGRLNTREIRKLDQGQAHVMYLKNSARTDGVITPYEYNRIVRAQNIESQKIHEAKHNLVSAYTPHRTPYIPASYSTSYTTYKATYTTYKIPSHKTSLSQRQYRQERRINNGLYTGALTPYEVRKLNRGQAYVDHLKYIARADGIITRTERQRIVRAQEEQSRRIYMAKHNSIHDYNYNGIVD